MATVKDTLDQTTRYTVSAIDEGMKSTLTLLGSAVSISGNLFYAIFSATFGFIPILINMCSSTITSFGKVLK